MELNHQNFTADTQMSYVEFVVRKGDNKFQLWTSSNKFLTTCVISTSTAELALLEGPRLVDLENMTRDRFHKAEQHRIMSLINRFFPFPFFGLK